MATALRRAAAACGLVVLLGVVTLGAPTRESVSLDPVAINTLGKTTSGTGADSSYEYPSGAEFVPVSAGDPVPSESQSDSADKNGAEEDGPQETVPESSKDEPTEDPAKDDQSSQDNTVPSSDNGAPEETAPESSKDEPTDDPTKDDNAGSDNGAPSSSSDPCKDACTPHIDSKASVMESYKRHRAQAALIGDYGSCKPHSANKYTWEVDWGDDEQHVRHLNHVAPFHAEHIYAKKGKYTIDAKFCAHLDGCDSGCTTISKKLKVKP